MLLLPMAQGATSRIAVSYSAFFHYFEAILAGPVGGVPSLYFHWTLNGRV